MLSRVENPRLVNIFTAPLKDMEPLKEQVRQKGSINMLMHPFSREHSQDSVEYPRMPGYKEGRDTIIQASSEEPLVIFEEARLVRNLPQRIREITTSAPEQLFIGSTEYNRPDPQKPSLFSRLGRKFAYMLIDQDYIRKAKWDQLANIFRWLGVEHVTIGGQYLTYFDANNCQDPEISPHLQECLEKLAKPDSGKLQIPDETDATKLIPVTCVGWTAQNLAYRGFNVSLTLPSSPRKILKTTAY